jgi:hypothetical protein
MCIGMGYLFFAFVYNKKRLSQKYEIASFLLGVFMDENLLHQIFIAFILIMRQPFFWNVVVIT